MEVLQKSVIAFIEKNKAETSVEFRLLDLVSEIGELSKEVLKGTDYGRTAYLKGEDGTLELRDVLFSLICLASTTGVDLEKALSMVLNKYGKRFEEPSRMPALSSR